jgi:CRP-like cAMP-binding protein
MEMRWHLSEQDFFKDLAEAKEEFTDLAVRREIRKNDFLFFENDPGDSCFYLSGGSVKIFAITLLGKEPTFMVRKSGEIFGLAEVVDGHPRKCNAQAIEPSVVYEISKVDFEALLSRNYPLARKVITVLGKRLRFLCEQVGNLMVCDVTTRLIKLLIYLAYDNVIDLETCVTPITLPLTLTQEQIACMTGSCQQTVSETLKKLQTDGFIEVSRKEITLLRPSQLLSEISH